uniref:Metalloendopeptidase n=1 Tax=Bombyx mori TaxID=7091 RepID=A0A8R2GAP2_BOMMO|nr:seminal metalloprotease 1 isoform X1 [Bombyx mori]
MFIILSAILLISVKAAPVPDELVGEYGDKFEGDMLLTEKQKLAINNAIQSRNGLKNDTLRWPNRTVVYHIEEDDFDDEEIEIIIGGLSELSNKSCVEFRAREGDEYAVIIESSANGCFSRVGFSKGDHEDGINQVLNLGKGCIRHGVVIHEMLHTLGFYHMQSTYDRDDFVKIVWENIASGHEHNFEMYKNDTVTDFGVPYDYGSVMHYSEHAFSKNGEKTIIPLQENVKIGQRDALSISDIEKLNKMYCADENLARAPLN